MAEKFQEPAKTLLAIRPNELDKDCNRNPQMAYHFGTKLAEAQKRVTTLEKSLKLRKAQVILAVHKDPAGYGLVKATELLMESVVETDEEYMRMQKDLIQAEYERDILKQFVLAIADRKQEIENMVYLFGQMYWSKPTISQENQAASEVASQARTNRTLSDTMSKRPHKSDSQ